MARAEQQMAMFTDRGVGEDLRELVAREPVDAIVIDHLLWGALAIAPECGKPFATLVHTLYGQQRDSWTDGPGAAIAQRFGFRPVELWHASRVVVVATAPELDPVDARPAHVVHTGVVWQGRPRPAVRETPPLVLLSLSTLALDGQLDVLQRACDALAELPVRAIVATGGAALRPPPNVDLVAYAPHETLMPRASLVITHGGHATTTTALAHDLPLLIIPTFPLGDQPAIARLLADRGAALHLDATAGVDRMRAAIAALLDDVRYRNAAGELGAAIRRADGAHAAADAIETLVAS
jgi:UDP:flavonoid glycosyltransferase YjiC (YdhE family)